MCTQKMRALSYIGAEKITFPPKPDGQTDIQTGSKDVNMNDFKQPLVVLV